MEVMDSILDSVRLPRPAAQVSRILGMLRDPDGLDIDDLTADHAALSGFEATLLSIINSSNYPLRREVVSLREATMYLGMRNISYLLIALLTKGLLPKESGRSQAFGREPYWRHCVGTSMAAMNLGAVTGVGDRYKLFTYGIVHDIGTAILDVCRPDLLDEIASRMREGGQSFAEVEGVVLGRDTHGEIGYEVFRRWGVPDEICEAVRYHHHPGIPDPPQPDLDLLYVADAAATDYYQRLLGTHAVATVDEAVLERLDVTRDDIEAMASDLATNVEADLALLKLDELDVFTGS